MAGGGAVLALAGLLALDNQLAPALMENNVHVVLIGLSVIVTVLLGAASLGVFLLSGSLRSLFLGAGFWLFAATYVWHGVFTSSGHPFAFLIYGPVARVFFGVLLIGFASRRHVAPSRRPRKAILVLASAVATAVVGLALHDPLSDWAVGANPEILSQVRIAAETVALIVVAIAGIRFLRLPIRSRPYGLGWMAAAMGLLVAQSVYFMATEPWAATWWAAHALGATSTIMLAGTVVLGQQQQQGIQERAQLAQLNNLKTEFINTAAHELGTPLTPIRLQVHMLQSERSQLRPEQAKAIDIIDRNVQRLESLSRRILDGSKSLSGELEVLAKPVDLSALATECVARHRSQAKAKGVHLTYAAPSPLWLLSDGQRIEQVINNLLDNALKYSTEGGIVTVHVDSAGDHAVITVADNGKGISPEVMSHLFQPFVQGPGEASLNQGSGLGLFVSKQIVRRLGGRISATTGGEGRGATFSVQLPLRVE